MKPTLKPVDLVFTSDQYARLHAHLFQPDDDEQAAYAFVTPADGTDALRLLVHHIITLQPDDFIQQSGVYLEVQPGIAAQIAAHAIEGAYGLVEIHSHPFADAEVAFSETDTEYALPRFRWFAEQVARDGDPRPFHHIMLVFGVNSADSLVYDRASDAMIPARRVIVLEAPLRVLPVRAYTADTAPDAEYTTRTSRQVAAFGAEGQRRLAALKVGIVGLGGIGSLVANELALLGVRHFVLVDADRVDATNLNRFVGGTYADIEAQARKIDVIARAIVGIDPGARVELIAEALPSERATAALRDVDLLFGCTDTHGSRLLLNTISAQYLLPYIDIGVGIFSDTDGRITEAGGQYRVLLPGRFCMTCIDAIDPDQAMRDLLPPDIRAEHQRRGYIPNEEVPAPSVIFLNAVMASLAVGEMLNLIAPYREQVGILYYFMPTQELRRVEAGRRADCVVCGAGGVIARGDLDAPPGVARTGSAVPQA
ncbi:MAG: ThiF family adenylyltransferase [Chloroflexota bacterium]|nr:ThiF family adenylyltransferase [Chloroflexota bacterium]